MVRISKIEIMDLAPKDKKGLISFLIKRNGYLDNIYVRSHLRDVLDSQDVIRRCFRGLVDGIWEVHKFPDYVDLVCLDRDIDPIVHLGL